MCNYAYYMYILHYIIIHVHCILAGLCIQYCEIARQDNTTETKKLLLVVSSYKESRNNMPIYGCMLPNLSPSPNLYKVQSVYNNNVAL